VLFMKRLLDILRPDISQMWHPSRNITVKLRDVAVSSRYKAWWKCDRGHEWQRPVYDMTKKRVSGKRSRCPYCLGRRDGSLDVLYPEVTREWDICNNDGKKPSEYSSHSHKKVWWVCSKGHSWISTIQSRTDGKTGCPECAKGYKTSKYECRIYSELMIVFDDIILSRDVGGIKADMFIPSLNMAIEVDGAFWHKNREDADKNKTTRMLDCCKSVIRFRQKPLGKLESCDILFGNRGEGIDLAVRCFLSNNFHQLVGIQKTRALKYLSIDGFQNEKKYREMSFQMSVVKPENSLQVCHPNDAKQWHSSKNSPLTPFSISRMSNVKFWWICEKGHEWQTSVYAKVKSLGDGCPYCDGKKVAIENSLAVKSPEIARQWCFEKNVGVTPFEVTSNSHKKVWWKCDKGHRWSAIVKNRVANNTGCPGCSKHHCKRKDCHYE